MPRRLDEIATPAVLVDVAVLERNLERMAQAAGAAGVSLRPHAKTHKVLEVGRRQLRAGAVGLTLAKTSEAEVFVGAGFEDIFLAYPIVGADKARRLLALSERAHITVGVDSVEGARTLADVFAAAGRRLDVRLKVDSGLHRVGVLPEQAVGVARAIAELPGLRLRGVFTFAGHAYGETSPEGIAAVGHAEGATLTAVADALRGAGLEIEDVSVGSTPTARHAMPTPGVTECRPGVYCYNDASQVSLGVCALEDCALTALATVVSVPAPDRAVVDAGSKTLSTDPLRPHAEGHGWILGRRARVSRLSEEHGVLAVEPGERFRVGERVRVLPNHACVVSNLHDRVLATSGEDVLEEWRVAARGRVE
jgi:D-serine deaminase-like pyridoxal phosphate-dependent protein